MKRIKTILCALALLIATLAPSRADSPEFINYQGLLNGADGQPLPTGLYTMEFRIYGSANGTDRVWGPFRFDDGNGNGHGPKVPVSNGRFNVIIGPNDTGGDDLWNEFNSAGRFIEIRVNGGSPILPRQQFLATPYAFRADRADIADEIPNVTPNGTGATTITGKATVTGNAIVDGNIGIGTTTPASRLTISQTGYGFEHTDGTRRLSTFVDFRGGWIGTRSNHDLKFFVNGNSGSMIIDTEGRVGIGTTTPTNAKLTVQGNSSLIKNYRDGRWYHDFGDNFLGDPGEIGRVSLDTVLAIWASGRVSADSYIAWSDERIKVIQGRSDNATDLQTLRGIEITDYRYKDMIGKGSAPHKKVIAQQVETVYPQAVSQATNVVPDIYERASIQDGWVALAADLKKGDRVKLIGESAEGIHEVLEVTEDKFRTDFKQDGDKVFVFGREVDDFRMVDYEAIAMLNVSATQELANRVESLEKELAEMKKLFVQMAGSAKATKPVAFISDSKIR